MALSAAAPMTLIPMWIIALVYADAAEREKAWRNVGRVREGRCVHVAVRPEVTRPLSPRRPSTATARRPTSSEDDGMILPSTPKDREIAHPEGQRWVGERHQAALVAPGPGPALHQSGRFDRIWIIVSWVMLWMPAPAEQVATPTLPHLLRLLITLPLLLRRCCPKSCPLLRGHVQP